MAKTASITLTIKVDTEGIVAVTTDGPAVGTMDHCAPEKSKDDCYAPRRDECAQEAMAPIVTNNITPLPLGDVLVYNSPVPLSGSGLDIIKKRLREAFPGRDFFVTEGGATLEAIRRSSPTTASPFQIGEQVLITKMLNLGLETEGIPGVLECIHIDKEHRVYYYVNYMVRGEIKQETCLGGDLERRAVTGTKG